MKPQAIITLLLMMVALCQSPTMAAAETTHAAVEDDLQAWLTPIAQVGDEKSDATRGNLLTPVARFYRMVDYRPVWVDANGLRWQGQILWRAIMASSSDGLRPDDYLFPALAEPWNDSVSFSDAIRLSYLKRYVQMDVALTGVMLTYANHLWQGRIALETLTHMGFTDQPARSRDLPVELAAAVKEDRLSAFLEALQPRQKAYRRLKSTLKQYEQIRETGGWPAIAPGPSLQLGDQGPRVSALRSRLNLSGDLTADQPVDDLRYDQGLETAVMRFQYRHGLVPDGVVGRKTLAAMSVPVDDRILQLQLNMERWRWYPDSFGKRYLMVNIPDFTLNVMEGDWMVRRMRAIVGKSHRKTPTLSGRMTYLELNPYWNIPRRIARKDILPKVVSDPDYLTRQGIRVFDSWDHQAPELDPTGIIWENLSSRYFPYRLRQDPSDVNALGRVKFMFPNPQSVYIHDTPGKALFNRQKRIFSSGCVRVETPLDLAQYLLDGQGWDRTRLEAAMMSGRRQTVVLDDPIPVHLVYFTAWVDADGTVNFREDIYDRDRDLLIALNHRHSDMIVCSNDAMRNHLMAVCSPLPTDPNAIADASTRIASAIESTGDVAGDPMTGL
ncbi:L,D-transpeptidase family protein [Desulfosarcina sp.]|uniref:L,D-transpeptidase family protein n=1 Tax=Desulfosarcina sp. TaxID=2027861 RepID=UPI0029B712BC|nr:L,D-transpeptidase family protein [Desulfosarcina sp.]MDX2455548.1 L,D-transpeptidase family protein [Desulfosarcina sp.]